MTLCFDILSCITEDQYAMAFIHDPNLVFKVRTKNSLSFNAGVECVPGEAAQDPYAAQEGPAWPGHRARQVTRVCHALPIHRVHQVDLIFLLYYFIPLINLDLTWWRGFPLSLRLLCLSCTHRILAYHKRCRVSFPENCAGWPGCLCFNFYTDCDRTNIFIII